MKYLQQIAATDFISAMEAKIAAAMPIKPFASAFFLDCLGYFREGSTVCRFELDHCFGENETIDDLCSLDGAHCHQLVLFAVAHEHVLVDVPDKYSYNCIY